MLCLCVCLLASSGLLITHITHDRCTREDQTDNVEYTEIRGRFLEIVSKLIVEMFQAVVAQVIHFRQEYSFEYGE